MPDQLIQNQLAARLTSPRLGVGAPNESHRTVLLLELDAHGTALTEVSEALEPYKLCGYRYDRARDFTIYDPGPGRPPARSSRH